MYHSALVRRLLGATTVAVFMISASPAGAQAHSAAPAAVSELAANSALAKAPGSIVYIKGYNVWIADGNGGSARQVTTGGTKSDPWSSPTQSDNGYVVAHRSGLIHRMNQRGQVFNVINPPDLTDTLGNKVSGRDLTETAVSPDGKKIAYTYFKLFGGTKRWVTGFTTAAKVSDPGVWGVSYYDKPAWVTNTRVVENAWYRNKSHLYDLGQRDIPWFDERSYTSSPRELSDLEVSRDGRWVVGVRGDIGDQSVVVLRTVGDVRTKAEPAAPTWFCGIGEQDGVLREPTIAPDGSAVAWAEPDGIWRVGDMNCNAATTLRLIIAGGSDPSWSKATIGNTPSVPLKTFVLKAKPRVVGSAVVGRVVTSKPGTYSPAPSALKYQWLRDGKAIPQATKNRYRVTAADNGHKIAVRVTVGRSGYKGATSTSASVKAHR